MKAVTRPEDTKHDASPVGVEHDENPVDAEHNHGLCGCCIALFEDLLVSRCVRARSEKRVTSGLKTNFNLSPCYSFDKSSYHKSLFSQTKTQILSTVSECKPKKTITLGFVCFFSLFIFRGRSTREPASSRVTDFILRDYTETGVSHS